MTDSNAEHNWMVPKARKVAKKRDFPLAIDDERNKSDNTGNESNEWLKLLTNWKYARRRTKKGSARRTNWVEI